MGRTAQEQGRGRGGQLVLAKGWTRPIGGPLDRQRGRIPMCAGCRAREARYGFQDADEEPAAERPRTLCFDCFRIEMNRRQITAARMARGWNARQAPLPLEETLRELTHRRRRAQIAARHALEVGA